MPRIVAGIISGDGKTVQAYAPFEGEVDENSLLPALQELKEISDFKIVEVTGLNPRLGSHHASFIVNPKGPYHAPEGGTKKKIDDELGLESHVNRFTATGVRELVEETGGLAWEGHGMSSRKTVLHRLNSIEGVEGNPWSVERRKLFLDGVAYLEASGDWRTPDVRFCDGAADPATYDCLQKMAYDLHVGTVPHIKPDKPNPVIIVRNYKYDVDVATIERTPLGDELADGKKIPPNPSIIRLDDLGKVMGTTPTSHALFMLDTEEGLRQGLDELPDYKPGGEGIRRREYNKDTAYLAKVEPTPDGIKKFFEGNGKGYLFRKRQA